MIPENLSEDRFDRGLQELQIAAVVYYIIGPSPLPIKRPLAFFSSIELLLRPSPRGGDTADSLAPVRVDEDYRVASVGEPGLEEQGGVDNEAGRHASGTHLAIPMFKPPSVDPRMDERLEASSFRIIVEHDVRDRLTIDRPVRSEDAITPPADESTPNFRFVKFDANIIVGSGDDASERLEDRRDFRLSGADASGETDDRRQGAELFVSDRFGRHAGDCIGRQAGTDPVPIGKIECLALGRTP